MNQFHYITSIEYQQNAELFCQQWQSGQATFHIQTSGSTGIPKTIELTREQMQASAKLTGKTFGLVAGDHALVCLNVEYIAGMMMLVRGMELGLKLTIIEPSSNPFKDISSNQKFDFAAFVPLQLQSILTENPEYQAILNNMKAIIVGGAAVSDSLLAQIQQLTVPVYSTYGMTEAVSHIAIRRLNGESKSPFFSTLEGVIIALDNRGCLKIKAAATNFEWIQTNDVVRLINYQTFELLGRADNIINSGGVKIQLEEIEKIIEQKLSNSSISPFRFFAYGIPDEQLGQKLILVLEGNEDEKRQFSQIVNQITFPNKYQKPKIVLAIPVFAETPTGKIDKKKVILCFS